MNTEQYEQLIAQAIAEAKDTIGEGRPSPARVDHALTQLAQRVARLSRDYYLLNLVTLPELAQEWGIPLRALQLKAADRHRRYGTGMLIGGTWVFAPDEVELLRRDLRRSRTTG